jgi:sulfotransferase family protein
MNPYLFIVGASRSGTTLLRRIVDAHPEIAITRETHWITKLLNRDDAVAPDRPVGPDLLERLATVEKFTRMDVDHAALERLFARPEPVFYAEFVSTVFDLYGKAQGKPLVGDKVPTYVLDIPVLHELFPHARFVHLIRDGRDVCSSVLDWERQHRNFAKFSTWEADRVSTTALWWERRVRAGREAGLPLRPELYRELRYEALVADPENACRELCEFLGVRYSKRMVAFHEGHENDDTGLSAKRAWRPITPGLRSWRTELTGEELERFEAATGPLLEELGYPRAAPDPSPAAVEHAARVRAAFLRDVGGQHYPKHGKA